MKATMYKGLRMTVLQSKNSRSSINYQWTNNRYFETRVMPNEDHRWINKRHFENHQGKNVNGLTNVVMKYIK